MRERAGSMCSRSHSHDGIDRSVGGVRLHPQPQVLDRSRAPAAVPLHERAEARERLLAGHLLLDDRRHQRLHDEPAAAQPPVRVVPLRVHQHRVPGLETARVVVPAEQPGHRLQRPVGPGPPRLGDDVTLGRSRPDQQRGRAVRRADPPPVPGLLRAGVLDAVRRVAAAVALLAEHLADRAGPAGSPDPLASRRTHPETL